MVSLPANKPLSVYQVLKNGYQLWLDTFIKVLPFTVLISIISAGMQFSMSNQHGNIHAIINGALNTAPTVVNESPEQIGLPLFSLIIFISVSLVLHAGMVYRIHMTAQQLDEGFDKAFFFGCKKSFPLISIYILTMCAIFMGLILLVVPGVVVGLYMFFSSFFVILEDKTPLDAIRNSFRIVSGEFWHTLATFAAIVFSYIILVIVVTVLLSFLYIGLEQVMSYLQTEFIRNSYDTLANSLTLVVLNPLMTTCLMTLFYDLKNRKSSQNNKQPVHQILA